MRLPRDCSGKRLVNLLRQYGYVVTRQRGSHLRLTTDQPSEHHLTIPNHDELRVGTLRAILRQVADHLGRPSDEIAEELFG